MMVKIAILTHGLIHNTKVILSHSFSTHLSTIKYKFAGGIFQYLKNEKITPNNNSIFPIRCSTSLST